MFVPFYSISCNEIVHNPNESNKYLCLCNEKDILLAMVFPKMDKKETKKGEEQHGFILAPKHESIRLGFVVLI